MNNQLASTAPFPVFISVSRWVVFLLLLQLPCRQAKAADADSVYLFSYATTNNSSKNGLHFAWSRDRETWYTVGNEFGFLKCDYGRWGSEKKMFTPSLLFGADGLWHCTWSVNDRDGVFAHASSSDLVKWNRQSYPKGIEGSNLLRPVAAFDKNTGRYSISFTTSTNKFYRLTTSDFRSYTNAIEIASSEYRNPSVTLVILGSPVTGQLHRVPWSLVNNLLNAYEYKQYRTGLYAENTSLDSVRFAKLRPVDMSILLQPEKARPISDLLMGVFFEDINYAADGGLYAELVQNRGFEYKPGDRDNRDSTWNSRHSWSVQGTGLEFRIDSSEPLHVNNPHYAVLSAKTAGAALVNAGFDGMAIRAGENYRFSVFMRKLEGTSAKLKISLVSPTQGLLTQATVSSASGAWKKIELHLKAMKSADDAGLYIEPLTTGTVALDMISLFPQNTFKGRTNGLRADLAQTIADLKPRFIRFPGGCVAHGDGLGNIYRWKNTIGPLESRVPQRNLWGYHQTAGLGYFEYFQYCEDVGAEPLPVLAAGVPCQNSGTGGAGQQGGIPMDEMDEYIKDIHDLIEYANGDVNTEWGSKRAKAGHPKPFNLKYIGIGNEDLITDVFEERFTLIYKAIREKHPEITIIGTVGPFSEGTDYAEGWAVANKLNVPMVDEHYYQPPGWFIYNQDFYDKYDRSKSQVYLGEYAAHLPGRPNNLETALAEAIYLTSLERNGDIVTMSSYAPLLAKEGRTQWNPDLIYFNNSEVKKTSGYYVQQLFGQHAGDRYIPSLVQVYNNQENVRNRVAVSVVRDTKSNDLIVKLVNSLPVEALISLDLGDPEQVANQAVRIVLQGKPSDRNLEPVQRTLSLSPCTGLVLPPYSFTVLRIQTN